ncbi:MAG TPA: PilW family protein [Steroidobacteraceae bacterium]
MNAHSKQLPFSSRRAQQGFTLVELSIAVLIGLFLLGGLLTLVQDMRRTYGAQNGLAQLQDSERLAMTLIADVIQAAGYYPDPTTETALSVFTGGPLPFTQPQQSIVGTHIVAVPGDTITVQFQTAPNDRVINCTGKTNTTGGKQTYINKFSINAAGNLLCTLGVAAPVTLIGGVTKLQILYGVKTNANPGNNVDTFFTATQLNAAPLLWTNVICVKVTLTFTNPQYTGPASQQPQTIDFVRVVNIMNRVGVSTT